MSTKNKVEITIEGDPDGDGSTETGVFVMEAGGESGLQVREQMRTGFLVSGQGQLLNTIFTELVGSDESANKGAFLDAGTSQHVIAIDFQGWEGSSYQWGNTGDDTTLTALDATGEDPFTQMSILFNWLRKVPVDSRPEEILGGGPATLEWGQYHQDGVLEPLDVVFEDPGVEYVGDPSTFDGQMTCIEAADLGRAWDSTEREG